MDSKWCRPLWLHLAAGISESGDTFRICHFLVPPRAEHPGQKPICQTTCPQFIVFTFFYIDLDKGGYLDIVTHELLHGLCHLHQLHPRHLCVLGLSLGFSFLVSASQLCDLGLHA